MEELLIDYIKKEREKGFDDETIKKALENVGYTTDQLDYAFKEIAKQQVFDSNNTSIYPNSLNNNNNKPNQSTQNNMIASFYDKEKKKINTAFMILAILIIFICFILLLNIIWSDDGQDTPQIKNNLTEGQKQINNSNIVAAKEYVYDDVNFDNIPLEGAGCNYEDRYISRLCRAVFKSDETICDTIEDDYSIQSCKDYVKITKAMVSNDKDSCNGLSSYNLKIICAAAIDKNDGICNNAPDSSQKEECINAITLFNAIKTKDDSKCDSPLIEDKDRIFCKTMISESDQIGKSIEPCRKYYDIRCP